VFAYTLGKKQLLRDHAFSQFLCVLREIDARGFIQYPHEFIVSGRVKEAFPVFSSHVYTAPLARRRKALSNPDRIHTICARLQGFLSPRNAA
jgi:hypothetical protein